LSAFVCILHRDGTAVEPRELHRLAGPLASYGDETASYCRGPLGLAVRHRGRAEDHLRVDARTGVVAAVAGRFTALDGLPAGGAGAAALLAARGDADPILLAAACGSFAVLVTDPARGRLVLARDHLGDVAVHYRLDRRRLLAASDPAALLLDPAVPGELDEAAVTRFLAFRSAHDGRSFFRHVRTLPPAHRLEVSPDAETVEPYWRFRRLPAASDAPEEVAAGFRQRLERAVARAVAGVDPRAVAVSLSGGLDSTAVAALAPRGLRAVSWTFEATPEADERPRIEAVCRHLGLPVTWVPGAGLHPLCDGFAERFVHSGSPFVNPFAALKCRLYEAARETGCRHVMVGDGGDALYAAREHWLHDLLAGRRPGALGSLATTLQRAGRGDRFARLALRRLLPLEGVRRAVRRPPPWLTAAGRAALPPEAWSPILPPGPRRGRHELAVGARHGELESEERRLSDRCGVERANPFWSWPLLEPAIQLPAWWYHRDGRDKVLAREALRGLLPASVLDAGRGGLLGAVFLRGLALRRDEVLDTVFRRPRSDWQRWVRRAWVEPWLDRLDAIAFGHTILWRVISYELWCRRLGA
jgi:asparagine synthase (glutamine-hydrolysing)